MANYGGLQATAKRLIKANGRSMTLRTRSSSYSTTTGANTVTETTATVYGVKVGDKLERVPDGDLAKTWTASVFLSVENVSTTPSVGDRLTIGADLWEIDEVLPLDPGGTTLLYECKVSR